MGKIINYNKTLLSSIKYYVYRIFYTDGKFKRLPFHNYNASKIYDWQKREQRVFYDGQSRVDIYDPDVVYDTILSIHKWTFDNIKYVKDIVNYEKKEHWATTDMILKSGIGDCEDQAFIRYRKMWEAGFPRDKIGIVCTNGHAFACYHFSEDDFYILDNGLLTSKIEKASEFFKRLYDAEDGEIWPIVGFNQTDKWSYK